jgi:phosphoglycerol transferase MdoB-like AlkP superfamily enzyme
MTRTKLGLLLLLVLLFACAGGPGGLNLKTPTGTQTIGPRTGTVTLRFTAPPEANEHGISAIRVTGISSSGAVAFSSFDQRRPEMRWEVPTTVTRLIVESLARSSVAEVYSVALTIQAGQQLTLTDPDRIDSAAPLRRLSLDADGTAFPLEFSPRLRALGTFADGSTADLSHSVAWSVLEPAGASIDARGLLSPRAPGTVVVQASLLDQQARRSLIITSARLTGIVIEPATLKLAAATSATLSAKGRFSDNRQLDLVDGVTWTSDLEAIATIDSAARLVAQNPGHTTVAAGYRGKTAGCAVTVTSANLQSLTVTPASRHAETGSAVTLQATGRFSDQTTQELTDFVSWGSSNPSQVVADQNGQATRVGPGRALIIANDPDSDLMAGTILSASAAPEATPVPSALAIGDFAPGTEHRAIREQTRASKSTFLISALLGLLTTASVLALRRARKCPSPLLVRGMLPCWSAGSVLLKSALAMSLMSASLAPTPDAWIWSLALLLCWQSVCQLLPQRLADMVCWTLTAAVSLLFLGDVLYYRQFQDFLMVSHFAVLAGAEHLGPEGVAGHQVLSLVQPQDLVLLVDLPILFALLWLAPKVDPPKSRMRWALPVVAVAIFVLGSLAWLSDPDPDTEQRMENRVYNRAHVRQNGLIAYHLYDLLYSVRPRISAPQAVADQVIRQRLALSTETVGPSVPGFGAAAGSNVILIQLESFQSFLIGMKVDGQEVTPFLNSLRSESLYGDALDQTGAGSSSDAMYIMLNSLHPPSGGPFCFLFPNISSLALPRILRNRGWTTLQVMDYDGAFWNIRAMGENFGFQEHLFSPDLKPPSRGEKVGWSLSDAALFQRLIEILKQRQQPFFAYVITSMMHFPFEELRPHQIPFKLSADLEGTMMGRYVQLARYRDRALELLVHRLKEEGLWDNTTLVLCGDHRARLPEAEYRRMGLPDIEPLRHRVPLFIRLPNGKMQRQLTGLPGQLDVAPTLLHVLGIKDAGQVFLGRNLLAGGHASASAYGYISDGVVGLWRRSGQGKDRFLRLSDVKNLPLTDARYLPLRQQLDEEMEVTNTLLYGNRILDFSP